MAINEVFFGGVPTDIEINRLKQAYPYDKLEVGTTFSHKDIEEAAGVRYGTFRYRTVTNRWRTSIERETTGLTLGAVKGVGFKVLEDDEKVDHSSAKLRSSRKCVLRSMKYLSRTDVRKLSDNNKKVYEHNLHISAAILLTSKTKSTAKLPTLNDITSKNLREAK